MEKSQSIRFFFVARGFPARIKQNIPDIVSVYDYLNILDLHISVIMS